MAQNSDSSANLVTDGVKSKRADTFCAQSGTFLFPLISSVTKLAEEPDLRTIYKYTV